MLESAKAKEVEAARQAAEFKIAQERSTRGGSYEHESFGSGGFGGGGGGGGGGFGGGFGAAPRLAKASRSRAAPQMMAEMAMCAAPQQRAMAAAPAPAPAPFMAMAAVPTVVAVAVAVATPTPAAQVATPKEAVSPEAGGGEGFDYTGLPQKLDTQYDLLDDDNALHPTTVKTNDRGWQHSTQKVLSPRTLSLLYIENTSVHRKGV
jgi:hypothetical protein